MKTLLVKWTLLSTLGLAMIANPALAAGEYKFSCTTTAFPAGMGSSLDLSFTESGELTDEPTLTLNDPNPALGGLKTNGVFYPSKPTPNEDGTPVIYLKWVAGAGLGQDGGEHLKLVPWSMAIYDFQGNYANNHTAFIGVIHWEGASKIEDHYEYQCHALPGAPSLGAIAEDFEPKLCSQHAADDCPADCQVKEYRIPVCVGK